MVVVTPKAYGVPEGRYELTVTSIEEAEFTNDKGEHPYFVNVEAKAIDPEAEDGEFRELVSATIGKKSRLRFLAEGFLGQELAPGIGFDTDDLIGRSARAFVGLKENGYNKILTFAKGAPAQAKSKPGARTYGEVFAEGATVRGSAPRDEVPF
jgi:hypothetical protein